MTIIAKSCPKMFVMSFYGNFIEYNLFINESISNFIIEKTPIQKGKRRTKKYDQNKKNIKNESTQTKATKENNRTYQREAKEQPML
jgi:hypothetical protein